LAKDNSGRQCARCQQESRDKLITPPEVPSEFWQTEQFAEAFAAQHMGRVARAYRTHPYHYAVYGPHGISQTLLGEWLGLSQAQVSRFETGPPLQYLDTLRRWAQVMRIPAELLWFRMPDDRTPLAGADQAQPPRSGIVVYRSDGLIVPAGSESNGGQAVWRPNGEGQHPDDAEHDPVLLAPWNSQGTVEVAVLLSSGGGRVKRRVFLALSGPALTAPAHQWLIYEPGPLVSGLAGHRVSSGLVNRLPAMIAELRGMDDVAGGGDVLSLAQYHFSWVAGLLDEASYDDATGRKLHLALAELGQLAGWVCHDTGHHGLAQRYYIAGLRAAHAADDRLLGAHILGSMAYQTARQGQPAEAVTLIESAVAGTRGQQTPRLLAELRIRQAYAYAILKNRSACMSAISQARAHVEQPARADDPPYLYWVRPAEITSGAGDCLLQLGQADQAAVLIEQGIAMFDAPFDRDRQMYLTHLTDALARPGKQRDLDAAAATGIEAINLAQGLSSARSVARIRELSQQLQPHATVPAVREFLERAEGLG
ncbi:MAG: helix-turn-helix domain-containing protein, partial [Actinobacteria bacterium]|nr:helix-turn-helix domain-containing protein [Actinomycetota bacterium]